MRIQIKIWNHCLKKSIKWIVILLFVTICYLFSVSVSRKYATSDINYYLASIGYYNPQYTNFFSTISLIYQYILSIYFTYICYCYEINNSFNNIVLRINGQKWLTNKLLVILSSNLIFRIFISIFLYLFFVNKTMFPLYQVINTILNHLLISIIVILSHNFVRNKKIQLILALMSVPMLIIFANYSAAKIISIIILLIINYQAFNIKNLTK